MIRDKLGDSLLAFATVQQYLKLRPGDDVTVLMRKDYAELVAGEDGFRLVRYRGGAQRAAWAGCSAFSPGRTMRWWCCADSATGCESSARSFRRGAGSASRASCAPTFSEWPPHSSRRTGRWWSRAPAAAVLEPGLAVPQRLELSLRPPAAAQGKRFVGVCPITDEKRKDMSQASLDPLLDHIARTHLGVPIEVLVRDGAENHCSTWGTSSLRAGELPRSHPPAGAVRQHGGLLRRRHRALPPRRRDGRSGHRGVRAHPARAHHPAAAGGGQCAPRSPRGRATATSRACRDPACIEQACANLVSRDTVVALDRTPADCPPRRRAPEARRINRWHRYPLTVEAVPGAAGLAETQRLGCRQCIVDGNVGDFAAGRLQHNVGHGPWPPDPRVALPEEAHDGLAEAGMPDASPRRRCRTTPSVTDSAPIRSRSTVVGYACTGRSQVASTICRALRSSPGCSGLFSSPGDHRSRTKRAPQRRHATRASAPRSAPRASAGWACAR
ncbi:MAG: hypothetical protein MZW92_64620 [Comamonadaceae bacterium]|nr:hypothetical protein [Comamonadaceae bacterium]